MTPYVLSTEQLVVEVYARDLQWSLEFYRALGFEVLSAVQQLGARVIKPIADRYYGLRDFTIADPDGFGLRFGTRLTP